MSKTNVLYKDILIWLSGKHGQHGHGQHGHGQHANSNPNPDYYFT